jgi:hypothetical protein
VQLLELQIKAAHAGQHHIGDQGRTIGIEEVIQGPPDPVITEVRELIFGNAKQPTGKSLHGFLLAVHRLTLHHD